MNALACKFGSDQGCQDVGFSTSPAPVSGASPVSGSADTKTLAQRISVNPNITFQTGADQAAFQQIFNTGSQQDCGTTIPISPLLLNILQTLADPSKPDSYKIVVGVFSVGHGCDGGVHSKGLAVDLNGVSKGGVSTGNTIHFGSLNAAQTALVRQFYTDIGNSFPDKTGGLGQYQCFGNPPPTKRAGVTYFSDTCTHVHVDVRQNN
jgi:hypothetical protein